MKFISATDLCGQVRPSVSAGPPVYALVAFSTYIWLFQPAACQSPPTQNSSVQREPRQKQVQHEEGQKLGADLGRGIQRVEVSESPL